MIESEPESSTARIHLHGLRWAGLLCGIAVLGSYAGCAELSNCDTSNDGNPPDRYTGGKVVDAHFMSSSWTGPLLPFPGGKRYDIEHGLGCVPYEIECWLSFSAEGTANSSIAPAAGNLCVIQEVTDTTIQIKNDTCSDMHVLVTASASCGGDAGAAEAGDDGGT